MPSGNVMILACSGGSNVGQLSNRAAAELTQEGFGKCFCLAGIGAHLRGFVKSPRLIPESNRRLRLWEQQPAAAGKPDGW